MSERYDAVHSHEEGGFIGIVLAGLLGVPHLYDMHSSLPQQLSNFAFSKSRLLTGAFSWMERLVIRRSQGRHRDLSRSSKRPCAASTGRARRCSSRTRPGSGDTPREGSGRARAVGARPGRRHADRALHRDVRGVPGTRSAVCGRACRCRRSGRTCASFSPADVRSRSSRRREQARAAGLGRQVIFAGQRPAEEIPDYLDAADVLVSPRSTGTNTPLKIYQYLRSGRPIVATRLLTHTQVLDDDVSFLTPATPEGFAAGILEAHRRSGACARSRRAGASGSPKRNTATRPT